MSTTEPKRIGIVNLQIPRGRTYKKKFTFTQNSSPLIDATWTVTSEIRTTDAKSSTLIESFTVDVTSIASGIIWLTLTEDATDITDYDGGYYDVLLVNAVGEAYTYVGGRISFYDLPSDED